MHEYKFLAAAIIEEAVMDVRELRRLKLFMPPDEFGPLARAIAFKISRRHIYERKGGALIKRPLADRIKYTTKKFELAGLFDSPVSRKVLENIIVDGKLMKRQTIPKWVTYKEAVSAVRFFDSQWFLSLAEFCGIDPSFAKRAALFSCTDEGLPPTTPARDEEWCDQQSSENPLTA